jgi:hypothetical protein
VLRPTDEFIVWVQARMPIFADDAQHIRTDGEAYLLPSFQDRAFAQQWVEERWRFFLEQQLMDWVPKRSLWPERLRPAMLEEWFVLEIREVVWDLAANH